MGLLGQATQERSEDDDVRPVRDPTSEEGGTVRRSVQDEKSEGMVQRT